MKQQVTQTPILIVGGGLVGLSAGLFLQHHRTPFMLIERNRAASPLPRSRGISARTMELFRQVGLQQSIEQTAKYAWKMGSFGGARRGATMLTSESLALANLANLYQGADPSPSAMTACPQTLVEPVLRQALSDRGSDVRFGWELLALQQDSDGVFASVRDPNGAERRIETAYLIAADGARSAVRRQLGIGRRGIDADRHYLNLFFEADLTPYVQGRTFSQCEIKNDIVSGLFLSMNNTTRWSFHLSYDPAIQEPRWSNFELVQLIKTAIGADIPVALHETSPWNTRVRVADKYGDGRVFLAGDAAHVMPPWGGFNANTGIADAHNIAWKLASVLNGDAERNLLDSYERERRPVACRNGQQAWLRSDFDARFQIRTVENTAAFNGMLEYNELQTRYRYGADDTVAELRAQPGTCFPHAWIEHLGCRRSTLDLFGASFVTVGGPAAPAPTSGVGYRVGVDFEFSDAAMSWRSLTGRSDNEAICVRPDGFVAIAK